MNKEKKYQQVMREILAVLDGEANMVARYATVSCLLDQTFEHFFWTGFLFG